jgi:hypothetical protein
MDKCTLKREQNLMFQPFINRVYKKVGIGLYDEDIFNVLRGILTLKMRLKRMFWPFDVSMWFDDKTSVSLNFDIRFDELHDVRIDPSGEIAIVYDSNLHSGIAEEYFKNRVVKSLLLTSTACFLDFLNGSNNKGVRCRDVCTLKYKAELSGIKDGENTRYSSDWRHYYSICEKSVSFKMSALKKLARFLNEEDIGFDRQPNDPIIESRNRAMQDEYFDIKKELSIEISSDIFVNVPSDTMRVWCYDEMMRVFEKNRPALAKRIDEFLEKQKTFNCFVESENEIKSDIFASLDFL